MSTFIRFQLGRARVPSVGVSLVKPRHDLLAQQLQCGLHLRMRDPAAAIQFHQHAIQPQLRLRAAQLVADGFGPMPKT
jgi:hypothetical protein